MHEPSSVTSVSEGQPSLAIIERVAALDGTDPLSLPPLYDAVDPDALDSLFQSSSTDGPQTTGAVQFTYYGYDVRVDADGDIVVES
ncbi:HalOD1 output domain-containing protein [Haloterrigena salifodinae]|uniref:HalOD1 output domain-containing protein n=1 Tax=Haloterrigena salifodinae TaxID=2675099 RepID=UPI000F85BDB9|nr:HalOD1 output domain-containing protein [Haloterrigena salifodinae]